MSLEHLVTLDKYVPTILADVKEVQALVKSEDHLFDILVSLVDKEYARMFIQTSDEIGVERFERIMAITADPSIESLEFRKQRLLTRSNATLPYSTIWLRVYLNAVLGEHNYELNIDYKNDIIRLYGYLLDYSWAREAGNVIADIKPCNMVFINIPTIIQSFAFQYWFDDNTWNDDVWVDENIWSDYTVLQPEQLDGYEQITDDVALQSVMDEMYAIRLNNSTDINDLITDIDVQVRDSRIVTSFTVPSDIKLLEYIEIIDRHNAQIFYTPCFIDTPQGTQIELRLAFYGRSLL